MGFLDGGIGGVVGGIAGLAGNLLGQSYASGSSAADRAWQKEVMQNQYQWKVADAKKAGLHPLAVLGGGAYSASPSSVPGQDFGSSLGKLGEGIGDAFTAYKNKEQIAAEAAWKDEQRQMVRDEHDAKMRESASKVLMQNGMALEATKRAESYSRPWATGREVISGQVDAPSVSGRYMGKINKFDWPINPDGSRGDPIPSGDYKQAYEDVPLFEFIPHFDALYTKWRGILSGRGVDGYKYNWRNNSWYR